MTPREGQREARLVAQLRRELQDFGETIRGESVSGRGAAENSSRGFGKRFYPKIRVAGLSVGVAKVDEHGAHTGLTTADDIPPAITDHP